MAGGRGQQDEMNKAVFIPLKLLHWKSIYCLLQHPYASSTMYTLFLAERPYGSTIGYKIDPQVVHYVISNRKCISISNVIF